MHPVSRIGECSPLPADRLVLQLGHPDGGELDGAQLRLQHGVAEWHLGLTEGAADETKARYAFVYGDFRRIHRTGLIACHYRAAEWRHKEIELAAHELLQLLDGKSS
jgi:hypothetical protein